MSYLKDFFKLGFEREAPKPTILARYQPGFDHKYVLYRKKKLEYFYADMPITRNHIVSYGFGIPIIIIAICPILAFLLIITSIRNTPRPLVLDYSQQEIIINDNVDAIKDSPLYCQFDEFQQITGITPAFVSLNFDLKNQNIDSYAKDCYYKMFSDEKHWLIVYGQDEKYWEIAIYNGKNTNRILDDFALDIYIDQLNESWNSGENLTDTLEDTMKVLNGQVMYSGIVKEDSFKFGLACIFFIIAAILGLAREFSVMKKEKFCKIPDHIEIGPTVKCPYCNGKMIKGMHKSCPHCESELYNIY